MQPRLSEVLNSLLDRIRTKNQEFLHTTPKDQISIPTQNPDCTIVACSDSRLHLESFSDQPQNRYFVVRNIGNQLANNPGSIDYGVEVLETPILLFLGHSLCGAVETVQEGKVSEVPRDISEELRGITEYPELDLKGAVLQNIHNQVDQAIDRYQERLEKGQLMIIGMYYDFQNEWGLGSGRIIPANINGRPLILPNF